MFTILKINRITGITKPLNFKEFIFPAGEVSVKLANDYGFKALTNEPTVIVARLQNSDDLIKLAMLKDALERFDPGHDIQLFMPYIPYARQDRVCDKGESFSLKVLANFINGLNFSKVTVVDPHSLVSEALIDRVSIISQLDVVNKWLRFIDFTANSQFVSPDAGSNKKTAEIAGFFGHANFIRADKLRDLTNGNIKETIVYTDDLKGQNVIILDDLCERGGTFILLAEALRKKNCGKISLYATHGVFGGAEREATLTKLFTKIDSIWTTNSYHKDLLEWTDLKFPNLQVLDLDTKFLVNL